MTHAERWSDTNISLANATKASFLPEKYRNKLRHFLFDVSETRLLKTASYSQAYTTLSSGYRCDTELYDSIIYPNEKKEIYFTRDFLKIFFPQKCKL